MSDKASEHEAWIEGAMSDVSFGHDSTGRACRGAAIPVGVIRQYLSTLSTYNEETHCVVPKWKVAEIREDCEVLLPGHADYLEALINTADTKPITEKGDEG